MTNVMWARRSIGLAASVVIACGTLNGPNESRDTTVVYYVESQRLEPWAPQLSGTMPQDWEASARDDLARAGLTAHRLEQIDLRAPDLEPAICAACPTGFVLKVELPRAEERAALDRCFVRSLPDFRGPASVEALTAARRTDCKPLYR